MPSKKKLQYHKPPRKTLVTGLVAVKENAATGSDKSPSRDSDDQHLSDSEEESVPCPLCYLGSGKTKGHRGRHLREPPAEGTSPVKKEKVPCPDCVEGSGRSKGHRGRHTVKSPEKGT